MSVNRTPNKYSYSTYTGRPYIYNNGIPIQMQFHCEQNPVHPYRTIVRTNENLVDVENILSRPDTDPYNLYKRNCK